MIDALTASLACIGPSRSTALTSPSTSQALQSVAGGLAPEPESENLVWWRELRGRGACAEGVFSRQVRHVIPRSDRGIFHFDWGCASVPRPTPEVRTLSSGVGFEGLRPRRAREDVGPKGAAPSRNDSTSPEVGGGSRRAHLGFCSDSAVCY